MSLYLRKRFFSSKISNNVVLPESIKYHDILHYRPNKNRTAEKQQNLAILIGWLGAKDQQMKSYLSFYHHHGFDTLSFAVGPKHVIYPHDAMKHMQNVWDTSSELLPNGNIVVHAFSMGGYLYGQSLRCIEKYPEKYGILKSKIRAQVFDSPPDHGSIAHGISKSFNLPQPLEKPIELLMKGYLKLTHDTSGVEHRAASYAFHNNFIQAPSIFFYSLSDPISRYQDCEKVINTWQKNGIPVEGCRWDNSPHIQHGRRDPERYFGELEKLLKSSQLLQKERTLESTPVQNSSCQSSEVIESESESETGKQNIRI